MLADNQSPFAAVGFEQVHRDGQRMAVAAVRACYTLHPDGRLTRAAESTLSLSDSFEGPPQTTPLIRTSDLVGFKPAADVTVRAKAHAPHGEPARFWTVGVRVGARSVVLGVHGARRWLPVGPETAPAFVLSDAEPALERPLDWCHAAGGRVIGDPRGDADARNPIGPGLIDARYTSARHAYDAPTIDSPAAPVIDPFARPEPQGFGAVPPSWAGRLRFAGTYDEAWKNGRAPRLPADFDYRFHNVAPAGLTVANYLPANERITLGRLTPGGGSLTFHLPDEEPYAVFKWVDGREVIARMNRDGLHVDLAGEPPWPVEITFRTWIEVCPRFQKLDLGITTAAGAADLPVAREHGLAEA